MEVHGCIAEPAVFLIIFDHHIIFSGLCRMMCWAAH